MFAKLFNSAHGQTLVQKTESGGEDDFSFTLTITANVASPIAGADVIMTQTLYFGDSDDAMDARDAAFDKYDQGQADASTFEPF